MIKTFRFKYGKASRGLPGTIPCPGSSDDSNFSNSMAVYFAYTSPVLGLYANLGSGPKMEAYSYR